jgi:hypothetical protein
MMAITRIAASSLTRLTLLDLRDENFSWRDEVEKDAFGSGKPLEMRENIPMARRSISRRVYVTATGSTMLQRCDFTVGKGRPCLFGGRQRFAVWCCWGL